MDGRTGVADGQIINLPTRRCSTTIEVALVAAICLTFVFLVISFARHSSATFDETVRLPAGLSYLRWHDYRLNTDHPPLLKKLILPSRVSPKFPQRRYLIGTRKQNGQHVARPFAFLSVGRPLRRPRLGKIAKCGFNLQLSPVSSKRPSRCPNPSLSQRPCRRQDQLCKNVGPAIPESVAAFGPGCRRYS